MRSKAKVGIISPIAQRFGFVPRVSGFGGEEGSGDSSPVSTGQRVNADRLRLGASPFFTIPLTHPGLPTVKATVSTNLNNSSRPTPPAG